MSDNQSLWHTVPVGPNPPEECYVIIETPRGSKNKYEISKDYNAISLDRVLHSSVVYPVEYGLIPRTFYMDGDPLDAMVLLSEPTHPGVVLKAKPIGIMHMIDQGDQDDKILMVASNDPNYNKITSIDQVDRHKLDEIQHFFEVYKKLEGKETEVTGWDGKERAMKEIEMSIKLYDEKFSK